MKDVIVLAAPGGNPAPLASVIWALHREGHRAARVELLLYRSANDYLNREFLCPGGPLEELREVLDDPELAQITPTLVRRPDGRPLEDDRCLDDHLLFMGGLWELTRQLARGSTPIVYALVGGRRRTLTVDMATTFQLLARPEDRLLDLRLTPKYANDPRSGFAFPEQPRSCTLRGGPAGLRTAEASEVEVELVEVLVPRLGATLLDEDKGSFVDALRAGERAARLGGVPELHINVKWRKVCFGSVSFKLSTNRMIWYVALAMARLETDEGWVDADRAEFVERAFERCRERWMLEPPELSKAYDWAHRPEKRAKSLAQIRSKLREVVDEAAAGHPHRSLIKPKRAKGTQARLERLKIPPDRIVIDWEGA